METTFEEVRELAEKVGPIRRLGLSYTQSRNSVVTHLHSYIATYAIYGCHWIINAGSSFAGQDAPQAISKLAIISESGFNLTYLPICT